MFSIKKVFSFFIAVNFVFFSGVSTSLAGIEGLMGYSHESAAGANPALVRYFYESSPQRLKELGGQEQLDSMISQRDFLQLSSSEHFQQWIDKIFMSSLDKNSQGQALPIFSWVWGMPQDLNLQAMYNRSSYLKKKVTGYFNGFLSANDVSTDSSLKLSKEKVRYRLIQDILLTFPDELDVEPIKIEPTALEYSVSRLLSKDRIKLVHSPHKALTQRMTFQILDTTFSGEYLEIAKYLLANPLQLDFFGNLAGHVLSITTSGLHHSLLEGTATEQALVPSVDIPSKDFKPAVHLQSILIALQKYIGANRGRNINKQTLGSFAEYLITISFQNSHGGDTSFLESLQVSLEKFKPTKRIVGSGAFVDDQELEDASKKDEGKANLDNNSPAPIKTATPNNTGKSSLASRIGYSLFVIVPTAILGGILYIKFKGKNH